MNWRSLMCWVKPHKFRVFLVALHPLHECERCGVIYGHWGIELPKDQVRKLVETYKRNLV